MARISSQGTVILIQTGALVPETPLITAVTKAKPAVLTIAAATSIVGDVVVPSGTGFKSIDNKPFKVTVKTASAVTLGDSDTTAEIPTATATGKLNKVSLVELCRSTFTINQPAGATIDVTTLCDDAHRVVSGLPAISTWQANGFYDYADAAMLVARDLYRSGAFAVIETIFRDFSGFVFSGNVNLFDVAAGVNAAVTNNIGGNVDGRVNMFPPPV